MISEAAYHIDAETIKTLRLHPATPPSGSQLASNARMYQFPNLENVYVMESDFYGNPMPEGSCFLAIQGKHGLIGRQMNVEKLRNCSAADLQKMMQSIQEG
jgi:hypothetical protein